jgi:DNA helicase-2/ATP-dependent DNA helicase PcrA
MPIYIGVHSFSEQEQAHPLIHDWRAPISSMFYDFELGAAFYDAPAGRLECEIELKRQYKIEKRQFRFMLESALSIQDDILQEELSKASDDKLKNIVATIQRDQNAIIRNEHSHTLVIQGAAGSGKTSIALHRIAYLLYRYKDTVRAEDILIISPNKVFAHYISQVLPELGEEMIRETTMEQLADELLDGDFQFQTFVQQVAVLLDDRDEKFADRVRFKGTTEFLDQLDKYIEHVQATNLRAEGLRVGMYTLDSHWIAGHFRKRSRLSVSEQLNGVVNAVVEEMKYRHFKDVVGEERARVRKELQRMFADKKLKTIYKNFYAWLDRPEMYKLSARGALEYADVYPMAYLKMRLEGVTTRGDVKHVVVDEMQDYSPVQYRLLSELYSANMTILGDRNQTVNPLSTSSAESIREVLPDADCVYMRKSYRSTIEITNLAQWIIHNPDLIPIERHGEVPALRAFRSRADELEFLANLVEAFGESGHNSMAIICKTQKRANSVYEYLRERQEVRLIDADSKVFSGGVVIATAYLAKGLEFDEVVVPFCSEAEYQNAIDRNMLYVAVTRAMHSLTITSTGKLSPFVEGAPCTRVGKASKASP